MLRNAARSLNFHRKLKGVPGFSNFLTELKNESRMALDLMKILPVVNENEFSASALMCSEIKNDIRKEEGWYKSPEFRNGKFILSNLSSRTSV